MERTNEKQTPKRLPGAAKRIFLRAVSAVILASLGVALILWNQGVFPLPFFGWHLTRSEEEPAPAQTTVEVTDYEAYRAAVLRSLFPYEQVNDGYLLVTSDPFDYSRMTLAYSSLGDMERTVGGRAKMRTAAGFLEVLSPNGATYSIPAEGIEVTNTAWATNERSADGKLLFSTGSGYLVWSYAENGLVPADPDENFARRLGFVPPLDWFSASERSPYLFRDAETGLYGYARAALTEEGEATEEVVVEARFAAAYPYNEGYAVAVDPDGREWVYDAEGNLLFEDRTLWAFEDEGEAALGCAYVQNGVLRAVESAVNENGEEEVRPVILRVDGPDFILPPGFEVVSFSEGIFVLSNGENVGYYSLEGKWTADPVYLAGGAFREGLAVVQNVDGMYGVIDSKGNEQIPCVFSYLCPFSDGVSVLYSDETGWQAVYKVRGVFGERGDDKPPIVTERPFVTRIPVSRNSESGRSDDEIYIFPSVVPPRRTTVPEWTQRPRPTVPGMTTAPDPTEPQTGEKPTTDAPPATQPPDPTEPSNQPGGGSGPQAPNPGQEVGF